ncbi:MAG: NAD-dependent epimerase/dehydratase family protein [Phycisphaerales bacterium]
MSAQSIDRHTHPKRVLITGGAGFIGSHLLDHHLSMGDHAVIIDNCSTGRASNIHSHLKATESAQRVQFIEGDLAAGLAELRDDESSFDLIYHLAAAVGVDLVLQDPIGSIRTNIMQTDGLLEFALDHGSPPTFIASSSEVYGKPGASVFSEEDDSVYGPTSITRWSYAHTKAIDEYLAMAYGSQHDLPVVVARFFNTVGPRQVGNYGMVLPRFVQSALTNSPLRVFGDGLQSRCFCDVRDVVRVLPKLLDTPDAHGMVMNIGSDRSISILELAERVITVLGSESTIEKIEYSDAYPSGFEDLRHRKPDLTRIRSVVDFEFEYSLDNTIQDIASEITKHDSINGGVL